MAMVLMNQLNYDVCDMINKVAMKTYKEDMKWKEFEMIISNSVNHNKWDFTVVSAERCAELSGVKLYETYDTKQKKDSLCKMFWNVFIGSIKQNEEDAYGKMLCSNKDKMFNIIDKYYLVNKWVEIDTKNDYIKSMIKDNTLKFKKNGDVDKRSKAWKDFGRVINDKPVIYQRQLTRKILDDDWMENYEPYELPEDEITDWCEDEWKWR